MARALTSEELELLRSDGQWTKLYLAVLIPNTVYTARLTSVPSSTDNVHTIGFTSGSGTLGDVKPGMTLYVGTSSGAHDLGMCRIRKAPIAGTFYIGLTSQIDWQSSCYLTVVDDFDLWAKHAVIDSGALKMDVDVAYSDQHEDFNPVPVLGPHAVVWLDEATVDVEFDASDSWVHGSTISAYAWSAPGADSSSGMSSATPTITYDAPGCYRVLCTVTAANGKTTTGYRHVFVYDRDENQPATVFQLAQCVADYDTGGWMFDLTMQAEASLSEIRDRSLVVLFAEDWFGGVKQSIGPIEGRENIVVVGRIVGQSIRWDRETGMVHFTVQGFHHWLNKVKGFPIQIQPATVADSWSEMPLMTLDRIIWHLLYWHSTVIETMDFYPSNDVRYAAEGMSMASFIWSQLVDIAFSKIMASPGVDRFGRLFVEVDPQMVSEADRDWPTVMALTDDDWVEGIDLQRVTVEDCSLIRLTTQMVNDSGGAQTLYSLSPGHTPRRYGEPEMLDRILAASQAESNSLAGLVLGWRTNEFPDVPVIMGMNNRMFDLWPHQFASLEMTAEDNPREVSYDGNLIPRRIALYFDGDIGYMHPELNFEGETFEQLSTNGDIPDVDEDDLTFPPLPSLPQLPDLPILIPGNFGTPSEDGGPVGVLLHDENEGLLYSENFNEDGSDVVWRKINAGLGVSQYQNINNMFMTPNGALYAAYCDVVDPANYTLKPFFIARAPSVGGTFTVIKDEPSVRPSPATGFINWGLFSVGFNQLVSEQVAFIIGQNNVNKKIWTGAGLSFAAGADVDTASIKLAGLSYGFGVWLHTRLDHYSKIAANGASVLATGTPAIEALDIFTPFLAHVRASTTGRTFHSKSGFGGYVIGDNNLATVNTFTDSDFEGQGFACDPTGQFIMTTYGAGARGRSSDGGSSWSSIGSLPFGNWWWSYGGGAGVDSRWVAAGGSSIRYSPDFGDTWLNKEGNLLSIVPIPSINGVKVLRF
ncbi:MAG TPA: PKD domain-containing protein [Anaerolineales bacterium]|nr:PKD domain-containing protein [Anaerolineales bacterium]